MIIYVIIVFSVSNIFSCVIFYCPFMNVRQCNTIATSRDTVFRYASPWGRGEGELVCFRHEAATEGLA